MTTEFEQFLKDNDIYNGEDPERVAYFQIEFDRRKAFGEHYNITDIQKAFKDEAERENKELLGLYSRIKSILKKYMDMSDYAYHVVTLWIIGTYCYEKFNTFPLLFINAVRGSGKTRLLKLIESMAWNGKIQANLSESVVFRSKKKHTMLIDEFEQVGSKESNTLRELINASYKRGARVERMKEVKKDGKKDYEVEGFDLYSPLAMANIWGMDDTVKDRCIVIQLDKSDNQIVSRLMEDFNSEPEISSIKCSLLKYSKRLHVSVANDDVDDKKSVVCLWNEYIYTNTLYTLPTLPTLATLFPKIKESGIYGRDLELFFPLFIISNIFGTDLLEDTINYAKVKVNEKNLSEFTENPDVILLDFLWKNYKDQPLEYIYLSDIKGQFQIIANLKELDTRTLSKSLERLNIILDKKRDYKGVKVMIDMAKVNNKLTRYEERK